MTTLLPAASPDNVKPSSSHSNLPVEIWLYILRLASNVNTYPSYIEAHNPFPDFPHVNDDLWQLGQHDADYRLIHPVRTIRSIVRVCREWNSWCTPFLYEDIEIGRYPCHELLLRTLYGSLNSAAIQACQPLLLPEPSSESAMCFETKPPELAKTTGLGQYVRKIAICKDSGGHPSKYFMSIITIILKCCPNVTSLTACWRRPPPYDFVIAVSKLYGPSLTHLSWQYHRSIFNPMANCWLVGSFMQPFRSLQVLDVRCLGPNNWEHIGSPEQEKLKGCVQLPSVNRIYLARSQRNLDLLKLLRLPALTHVIMDMTSWGYTRDTAFSWNGESVLAEWRNFLRLYQAQLTYVQMVADIRYNFIYGNGPTWVMVYTAEISSCQTPRLTRLEFPLELVFVMTNDAQAHYSHNFIKPMPNLLRLDLGAAAPPHYECRPPIYADFFESGRFVSSWSIGITRERFPILETVHVLDMDWAQLGAVCTGLRRFAEIMLEMGVRCFDIDNVELTSNILDELKLTEGLEAQLLKYV